MVNRIDDDIAITAWEDGVVQLTITPLEPSDQRLAGRLDELKLQGSVSLLHQDGEIPNATAGNDVTDANLAYVTTAQLAIDREVEQRSVPWAPPLVKPLANSTNVLRFKGALLAQ